MFRSFLNHLHEVFNQAYIQHKYVYRLKVLSIKFAVVINFVVQQDSIYTD